jgi:hypothetical protein
MLKKILKFIWKKIKAVFYGFFWYVRDLISYWSLMKNIGKGNELKLFPQIFDRDPSAHTFDKHYVYMDRWAFKHLLDSHPAEHVDIGSSIRFLSMASAITKVKFVDIRPIKLDFENFECAEGSILNLPFQDNSIKSLSCLHVAEHIGLGRYGDPLDIQGSIKACKEIKRVLAVGGTLYFAVPIGKEATYFNAHRVFNPNTIISYFPGLRLEEFSAVNDAGHFIKQANLQDFVSSNYSCGMFKFVKS